MTYRIALVLGLFAISVVRGNAKDPAKNPIDGKWASPIEISVPLPLLTPCALDQQGFGIVTLELKSAPSGKLTGKVGIPEPCKPRKTASGAVILLPTDRLRWEKIEMGTIVDREFQFMTQTQLNGVKVKTVWIGEYRDSKTLVLRREVQSRPASFPETFSLTPTK